VGICKGGKQECAEDGMSWGACEGEIKPQVEDCTKPEDEDCSGYDCAEPLWSMRAGDAQTQSLRGVEVDMDQSVTMIGSYTGTVDFGTGPLVAAGIQDLFLARLNSSHAVQWTKAYGGAMGFSSMKLAGDKNADVLLAGTFESDFDFDTTHLSTATGGAAFVGKIHRMGKELWAVRLGKDAPGARVRVQALATDAQANVVVAGSFRGCLMDDGVGGCAATSATQHDLFVLKLDSAGKLVWFETFADPTGATSSADATNLVIDADGAAVLAGDFAGSLLLGDTTLASNPGTDLTAFLVKLSPKGAPLWTATFPGAGDQVPLALTVDSKRAVTFGLGLSGGSTAMVGDKPYASASGGGHLQILAKLDADGSAQWSRSVEGLYAASLAVDAADELILGGSFQGTVDLGGGPLVATGAGFDALIAKLGPDGAYRWARRYGDDADQFGVGVAVASTSQRLYLAGTMSGSADFGQGTLTSAGADDVFLAQFAP
jgi:hypothetical protein